VLQTHCLLVRVIMAATGVGRQAETPPRLRPSDPLKPRPRVTSTLEHHSARQRLNWYSLRPTTVAACKSNVPPGSNAHDALAERRPESLSTTIPVTPAMLGSTFCRRLPWRDAAFETDGVPVLVVMAPAQDELWGCCSLLYNALRYKTLHHCAPNCKSATPASLTSIRFSSFAPVGFYSSSFLELVSRSLTT